MSLEQKFLTRENHKFRTKTPRNRLRYSCIAIRVLRVFDNFEQNVFRTTDYT